MSGLDLYSPVHLVKGHTTTHFNQSDMTLANDRLLVIMLCNLQLWNFDTFAMFVFPGSWSCKSWNSFGGWFPRLQ